MALSLCRRHGLTAEESKDFVGAARLKMVENDYDVIRKFRGEAAIVTYLAVVLSMLMREYYVKHRGRWRPSADARRHGDVAIRLETLVYRQGYKLNEAAELMRSSGATTLSDRDLSALLLKLPRRVPMRPEDAGEEPLLAISGDDRADAGVVGEARVIERRQMEAALKAAIDRLDPEDRLIIRMRFWEGMSVADIARALGIPQKPLYRRVERLMLDLRRSLEAAGVLDEQARAVLAELAS